MVNAQQLNIRGRMVESEQYPATFDGWLNHFRDNEPGSENAQDLSDLRPFID